MPQWFGGSALSPVTIEEKDQWRIQWNRVLRWYSRVQILANKSKNSELSNFDDDELIAFFQNCFHVKDYLLNSYPDFKIDIDNLFSQNIELRFCRDIANGYKHKKIDRRPLDSDFNWYREYDYFETKGSPIKYRAAFENPDTKEIVKFDIFDLCNKCIDAWKDFLVIKGLEESSFESASDS